MIKSAANVKQIVTDKYNSIPPRRIVTTSNIISLTRAFLTVPILYYLRKGDGSVALIFILIAIVTDMLDGWLARISREITEIGKVLDPFADAVVLLSVMLFLIIDERMPVFFFMFMVVRYFIISLLAVYLLNNCGISPCANKSGKVSILFTALTVLAFLYPDFFGEWVQPIMWGAVFFMTLSGIQYILDFGQKIWITTRDRRRSKIQRAT